MKKFRAYFVLRGFIVVENETAEGAADNVYADKLFDAAQKMLGLGDQLEPIEVTQIEEVTEEADARG